MKIQTIRIITIGLLFVLISAIGISAQDTLMIQVDNESREQIVAYLTNNGFRRNNEGVFYQTQQPEPSGLSVEVLLTEIPGKLDAYIPYIVFVIGVAVLILLARTLFVVIQVRYRQEFSDLDDAIDYNYYGHEPVFQEQEPNPYSSPTPLSSRIRSNQGAVFSYSGYHHQNSDYHYYHGIESPNDYHYVRGMR